MAESHIPASRLPTQGSKLLRRVLRTFSQRKVARAIGSTQPNVSMWARDLTRPGVTLRAALDRAFGIPSSSWLTKAERKALRLVKAA